ncbi:glycosyltransferase [Lysinibacillus piscis]|uniref:Glycosyltransferase EpsF n=1 Tax=Lysinibacillus piscis TaxID=2518931 RepID=A0ABQ5NGS3_9BACI|nr:glycosyltransferase [Lysinibacillus sp. KH24]GLC87318.1 putative glycosyltransferase EpsF [Lysinibacillus sp. KH24]
MKKILHIIPTTDFGGITTMILDIWTQTNKALYHFDFVVFNKGFYHEHFMAQGSQLFYQPYITEQGPIAYMKNIYQIIRHNGYEAVHDHTGYRAMFTMFAARLARVPCRVLHSHTTVAEQWNQPHLLAILKKLSTINATTLLACSPQAGAFCFDNKPFDILANPVNIANSKRLSPNDKERYQQLLGIKDNQLILGHIGRFMPVKNHAFLLKLAQYLKNKDIAFQLFLVGEGPLEQKIQAWIAQHHLQESVKLLGQRADIFELLQLFDVLLLPSLEEGFGMVLLEAQLCGTPAIASSTVPKEPDLELGLVTYLDTQGELEEWVQAIVEKRQPVSSQQIVQCLYDKGLHVTAVADKLCTYYER